MEIQKRLDGFRGEVSKQTLVIRKRGREETWEYYDNFSLLKPAKGKRDVLVCIPPTCASGIVFFEQLLGLAAQGNRAIALSPPFDTHEEFETTLDIVFDELGLSRVHLLGCELGALLALNFYQFNRRRILSVILCNPIAETDFFRFRDGESLLLLQTMLNVWLQDELGKDLPENESGESPFLYMANNLVREELDLLSRQQLISRLSILRSETSLDLQSPEFSDIKATIVETMDHERVYFPYKVRNTARKLLWRAKLAHVSWGGDFPYLSNPTEFNIHLNVHLATYPSRSVSPPPHVIGEPVIRLNKEKRENGEGKGKEKEGGGRESEEECDGEL